MYHLDITRHPPGEDGWREHDRPALLWLAYLLFTIVSSTCTAPGEEVNGQCTIISQSEFMDVLVLQNQTTSVCFVQVQVSPSNECHLRPLSYFVHLLPKSLAMADSVDDTQLEETLLEQPILIERSDARTRIWEVSALLYGMAQDAARWARTPGVANRRSLETFQVKTMLVMSNIDSTDIYRAEDPQGVLDHFSQQASKIRRDWHALRPMPQQLKKEETDLQGTKKEEPEPQVSIKEEIEIQRTKNEKTESQELKRAESKLDRPPAKKPCKFEDDNWDNE